MFNSYFCPRVAARLRAGPEPAILAAFLERLHRRGHTRGVTQDYTLAAEGFLHWLRRRHQPVCQITDTTARAFASRRHAGRPRVNVHAALRHLLRLLREQGRLLQSASQTSTEIDRVSAAYDTHLQDVAGLTSATRLYRCRYAREFLNTVFGTGCIRWGRVRPTHVHAFITRYTQTGRPAAARVAAHSLRSFLRWIQINYPIDPALIAAIPAFRQWRHMALPQPLTDEQYRTLLTVFDPSTAVGLRDYAIAVCMGELGLRCGEVPDLTLDDLDSIASTLQVAAGKSRRGRVLPMPAHVLQAVLTYIRDGRPASTDRHLFLRHRTPRGIGVTRELVRGIIRRAFARVPGCERQTGTHVLRHTAATRLHRAGADVKRVADIFGHRSIDTTSIYAKVDRDRLGTVALPWPARKEVCS